MTAPLQWEVAVTANAPLETVWDVIEDLSLIPSFHPVVGNVELVSGSRRRAPGVEYKCVVPEGRQKGWCVERVVEHVALERTSVTFGEDSWGMGKRIGAFLAETRVGRQGADRTRIDLLAHYQPLGALMSLLNALVLRRLMQRRARRTLEGLARLAESRATKSAPG